MSEQQVHAVVFHDPDTDQWVGICLEYQISTFGGTRDEAFEMVREAVELHLECSDPFELENEFQKVDGEPEIRTIAVDAPAILSA